jgi:hypothetical protein
MQPNGEALHPVGQQCQEMQAAPVVEKDRLPRIAAAGQVLPATGHFDPQRAGHQADRAHSACHAQAKCIKEET